MNETKSAMMASEVRYRRLFETAQDGILILDADNSKIVDSNPFLSRLLGYSAEELRGKQLWEIGLFRDIAANQSHFRHLQEKGNIRYEDLPLETKDGRLAYVEFVSNVYPVNGQKVIQCNIRDISDRKRAEEALRDVDRRKDEFLAMLAHELRNPLAPLLNAAQIMRLKGTADPDVRWAGAVIERQVQQLTRLINDLLDVSRISSGKVNLQMEPVDLADVVSRAVEISRPLIDARKQVLEISLPDQPVCVLGDLVRLSQILSNLLNNAAKFTDAGGRIELTVQSRCGEAVLSVKDTGVGIPVDMLAHVFEMFAQLKTSANGSDSGLGIGLNLVRQLVDLHGGRVAALSEGLGHGSEFVVRLPLLHPVALPSPIMSNQLEFRRAHARNILIVDDNRDAADILAMLLRESGHDVRTAYDGPTALELVQARPPDAVLLDIGMEGMDGMEVAHCLRRDLGLDQALLIALTGYGAEEDRFRTRQAGFDAHLVKPAEFRDLELLLANPAPKDGVAGGARNHLP